VRIIAPCTRLSSALATGRAYIKIHGRVDDAVTIGGGRSVTILGDPRTLSTSKSALAVLTHTGNGAALTVRDDQTSVSIYDVAITGVSDNRSPSVIVAPSGSPTLILRHASIMINAGIGISVQAGTFEMSQSTIVGNAKGGLEIGGAVSFEVVSNVFANNGNATSVIGRRFPDRRHAVT
jgi:hypothetical protein